ncbi:hypothetical protein HOY81_09655 [Streptomyces sp. JJ36]|nr:hypothetical protein [Streptomyces sp. JJ36]
MRVLGADVLAPATLSGRPAVVDTATAERACADHPPRPGASATTRWSHWGLREALRRLPAAHGPPGPGTTGTPTGRAGPVAGNPATAGPAGPSVHPGPAGPGAPASPASGQPDADWVAREPWQRMTHHLAHLASLAVPGIDSALRTAVAARPVDLARGFVRAVRRRDWLQAAGAGRWLALTPGVPSSVGLGAGLDFVEHMAAEDARVVLQTRAARLLLTGEPA